MTATIQSQEEFDQEAERMLQEFWQINDLKGYVIVFILKEFGIRIQQHPKYFEELYDLFKITKQLDMNLGQLIKDHLVHKKEIKDMKVLKILIKTKEILHLINKES